MENINITPLSAPAPETALGTNSTPPTARDRNNLRTADSRFGQTGISYGSYAQVPTPTNNDDDDDDDARLFSLSFVEFNYDR